MYDPLSTLWQRQDPAFVEILELLTKEIDEINFHVVLIVELFLTKMARKRTEQMVVRWSQVRRIRRMKTSNPSELQQYFTGRLCNMKSRVVMQMVNSILFSREFFSNTIHSLTVEIGDDGETI